MPPAMSRRETTPNADLRKPATPSRDPHGVINVGIFGEGTDSPSLNAVAFLEARKSPIDVIQAVGRAMRTADDKDYGYIICPIVIPPSADPESWLSTSDMDEGWQELGQILLALRAQDQRIEDNLADLLTCTSLSRPRVQLTIVAFASGENRAHFLLGTRRSRQVKRKRQSSGYSKARARLAKEFTRRRTIPDWRILAAPNIRPMNRRKSLPASGTSDGTS